MSILRRINLFLLAAALITVAAAGLAYWSVTAFDGAAYDERAAELEAEAENVCTETVLAGEELDRILLEQERTDAESAALNAQLEDLKASLGERTALAEELRETAEVGKDIYGSTLAMRKAYGEAIRRLEEKIQAGESSVKICYWTFDDGPTYITEQFLDALQELGIRATFFTSCLANNGPNEAELLRREALDGHSVQNHSYTHWYTTGLYFTLDGFREQVIQQDEWVFENTGFHTEIFRFPGGSAWATHESLGTAACIEVLEDLGLEWIDWSCNIYDAGTEPSGYDGGARVAVSQVKTMDIAVLLSHDWNIGTVYALKIAVPKLRDMGYEFLPLFPQSVTMGENTQIIFK